MVGKKGIWYIVVLIVAILAAAGLVYSAEHPSEHPTGSKKAEHPAEHSSGKQKTDLTKENLAKAIRAYVEKEAALKGGYFLVYDKQANKPLVLSLKKVHKDRLATVGSGVYFACADFITTEGKLYDLDIFMKGHDKGHLKVTQVTIHKEEGKERYTWFEEGGIWKMKPLVGAEKGHEHPAEHPMGGSETKGSETKGSGTK